jgi:hypothetical protein
MGVDATEQQVAAARAALRQLDQAVAGLARHYRDSVDVRRVSLDVQRLAEDLDLLAGPEHPSSPAAPLEIIEDREYPPDFWQDARDEGVGPR